MRKSKLTAAEIQAAEKAVEERKQSRKSGFDKMKERDLGHARLHDYNRSEEVWMHWGFDDTLFRLEIKGGKNHPALELVFDAEEFRRSLRWV